MTDKPKRDEGFFKSFRKKLDPAQAEAAARRGAAAGRATSRNPASAPLHAALPAAEVAKSAERMPPAAAHPVTVPTRQATTAETAAGPRHAQEAADARAPPEARPSQLASKLRGQKPALPNRPVAKTPPPNMPPEALPLTEMPPVPPGHREVESTPIVPERAWVRILLDENTRTYVYEVIEPTLTQDEKEILEFLRDTLTRTLDGRKVTTGDQSDWATVLVDATRKAIEDYAIRIDERGARRVEYYLVRDFLGYGRIDVMMRDGQLEDISCDGPNIPIYLFHRKYESLRSNVVFTDELELDGFVIRLAQRCGKHISVADPLLDATLPDGSRLQTTLSREVTTRGSSFTVRKFRADPMTPPDLVRFGTMSAEMAAYFWFVMEMGASFMIAGGTASGKTTSLNAISQFIPPEKKIVSIEDTREINLSHENWIAGITRSGFGGEIVGGKLAGTIDMYKLLEAALRQRPEYLLVGEVRGPEALTLFQAMATGHAVYSTMHADSVASAVYRLEGSPINVPRMMLQTLDIIAIQGQVRLHDKMTRRIREVTEVVGFDPETKELLTNKVFDWDVREDKHRFLGKSYVLEQVRESRNMPEDKLQEEFKNRIEVIEWMMRENIRHYADVARAVSAYYRDPHHFLEAVRKGKGAVQMAGGGNGP